MKQMRCLIAAAGLATLLAIPRGALSQTAPLRVVVNSASTVGPMSPNEVSGLFLKRTLMFPNGLPATPVDQIQESANWTIFARWIHRKSGPALQTFWQDQIFSGRASPPPELPSDAEVLDFVRRNLNGIGYVSSSARPVPGVRLLAVTP
jgi:hypothetical protein